MTERSLPDRNLVLPTLGPLYDSLGRLTEPALRIAAGVFLVPHGAQKLFGWFGGYGLEATGQFFQDQLGYSNGYLAALGAGSVEFFGGLLLALGLFTRLSAAAVTVLLLVALSVHLPNGFFWNEGGIEYPLLWALLTASFVIRGGGTYSLDAAIGKEL